MTATRTVQAWRDIQISYGATLEEIANQELGDVSRWVEIADLNGLRYPYLVRQELKQAFPGTLAYGETIKVPSRATNRGGEISSVGLFGADCAISSTGKLLVESGDLVLSAGVANLSQALRNRIVTSKGEILRHTNYGCLASILVGQKANPLTALLAHAFVVDAIRADPRVSEVMRADVVHRGDAAQVTVSARSISGAHVGTNAVLRG